MEYPSPEESYSPEEFPPEYPFERAGHASNRVYGMVRQLLVDAGLDAAHLGTDRWNPLGGFIAQGASVFVLCNFVYHRRVQETIAGFRAKCVHGSVLRSVLDYVLLATGPEGRVRFGNAPLQSCRWSEVLKETGAAEVLDFYRRVGADVEARDLRLYVTERDMMGRVVRIERRDQESGSSAEAIPVDLGADSLLAELGGRDRKARFRVSDYDPRRIESFHREGSHRYLIHREILDADVVISLSKLKTHEKVGITCGLKGFVGAVAHKDCLAHHRFGGRSAGGDEYARDWRILNGYSRFHDWVNTRENERPLQGTWEIVDKTIRRVLRRARVPAAGAWHGNDTCWRMALDLARIVHYADRTGTMREAPQRRHLSFIDGIVAGEGDGPLAPHPVAAGALIFADNVAMGDRVACRLMGYDPAAVPLVANASRASRYPLAGTADREGAILLNGEALSELRVPSALGRPFRPPAGWKDHFEGAA